MDQPSVYKINYLVILSLIGLALSSPIVAAQSTKFEGLINSRNGDTMVVRVPNSASVTVLLTDSTEVGQIQGVFKARRKQMSMAALIPGLAVRWKGRTTISSSWWRSPWLSKATIWKTPKRLRLVCMKRRRKWRKTRRSWKNRMRR